LVNVVLSPHVNFPKVEFWFFPQKASLAQEVQLVLSGNPTKRLKVTSIWILLPCETSSHVHVKAPCDMIPHVFHFVFFRHNIAKKPHGRLGGRATEKDLVFGGDPYKTKCLVVMNHDQLTFNKALVLFVKALSGDLALTWKAFQFPCTRDLDRCKYRLVLRIQIGSKGGFSAGHVDIARHLGRHELVLVVRRVGDIHQLDPMIFITANEKK
jgi:hypothetical protein